MVPSACAIDGRHQGLFAQEGEFIDEEPRLRERSHREESCQDRHLDILEHVGISQGQG